MEPAQLGFLPGAPIGWTPKSCTTWGGRYLPYPMRMEDLRFDLGKSTIDFSVIELDLVTGETKEWDSYQAASDHYGVASMHDKMRKGRLLGGTRYIYAKMFPPSAAKLSKLRALAHTAHAFGDTTYEEKASE